MERQILCSNPRIILNPLAGEMISRFGCYVYDGTMTIVNKKLGYFDKTVRFLKPRLINAEPSISYSNDYSNFFDCSNISSDIVYHQTSSLLGRKVCSVTDDIINSSYFVNPSTGECFPMYFKVRCGKCENCRKSKVFSLVQRCKLESLSYKFNPIFLTLTYDEQNKPKQGVSLRDCQLFFKRLRINLQRAGYSESIRYLLVSEYGTKTSRPHYHTLIWNLHQSDMVSYRQIGEIIKASWNKGFVFYRQVDMRDDKAFFYTSKYLDKGTNVPEGQNKSFMVCSNRGGAIGSLFLAVLAPELRRSLSTSPKYYNHFTDKVENLSIDRFVLDKIFPSVNRSLTSPVRSAVKRFILNFAALQTYEDYDNLLRNSASFEDDVVRVFEYFSRFMYIYRPERVSFSYLKPYNVLIRELDEDFVTLNRFIESNGFFYNPLELDTKRNLFLSKLLRKEVPPLDLDTRAREWIRLTSYLQQFEVF